MAFTLELYSNNGNINLTEYVAAQAGEGLDPAGAAFTTKILAHSILKPGSTLALEDLKEKLQTFPLKLNAENKTKLDELVETINIIVNTYGCQVEWRDEGATESTYWNLISGQFDAEYDKFRGEKNWLYGKLRLFVQPLGYVSKKGPRALHAAIGGGASTIVPGTAPLVIFKGSEILRGDAPALLQVQILSESTKHEQVAAVSILPSLEFVPLISGVSGAAPFTPTYINESEIPTGTAARFINTSGEKFKFTSSKESKYSYVGENRILVAARTPASSTAIPIKSLFKGQYGPVASVFPTTAWRLYDLGTINTASSYLYAGEEYNLAIYLESVAGGSRAIDIGALIQLPDRSTSWLNTSGISVTTASSANQNCITFDGMSEVIRIGSNMGVPASGVAPSIASQTTSIIEAGAYARGAIPTIQASDEEDAFAILVANMAGGSMNTKTRVNINVLERCRYTF